MRGRAGWGDGGPAWSAYVPWAEGEYTRGSPGYDPTLTAACHRRDGIDGRMRSAVRHLPSPAAPTTAERASESCGHGKRCSLGLDRALFAMLVQAHRYMIELWTAEYDTAARRVCQTAVPAQYIVRRSPYIDRRIVGRAASERTDPMPARVYPSITSVPVPLCFSSVPILRKVNSDTDSAPGAGILTSCHNFTTPGGPPFIEYVEVEHRTRPEPPRRRGNFRHADKRDVGKVVVGGERAVRCRA